MGQSKQAAACDTNFSGYIMQAHRTHLNYKANLFVLLWFVSKPELLIKDHRIIPIGKDLRRLGSAAEQTRLLRALSNWVLKTSKAGDDTTSLDKVFLCFTALMMSPYIPSEPLLLPTQCPCSCFLPCATLSSLAPIS